MKSLNSVKLLIYLFLFFGIISCGKSDEEKVDEAIQRAKRFLSTSDCSKALEVLNEIGYQAKNSEYLQVYSSGQACHANFNEPTFFATDLPKLGTVSQTGFFGSLSTFSTSQMTAPTSGSFINLKSAIETLLYAGGITSSSHANRLDIFTPSEASNMGVQALYMIIAQMGQYLKYYGDASSAGVKAGGAASNTCLITYTDATAITGITGGSSGACTDVANTGHDSMEGGTSAADRKTRICHFIVLFNNFVDIIANVSFTGDDTGALGDLTAIFNTLCADDVNVPLAICGMKNQSTCEAATTTDLEIFFAWIIERNFL